MRDSPGRVVIMHLAQIAVVTYVVANAVLVHIPILLSFARKFLRYFERFQNRTAVRFSASQIVYFGAPRCFYKRRHELGHILGMNVVANLFAFIAENTILATLKIALHEVT